MWVYTVFIECPDGFRASMTFENSYAAELYASEMNTDGWRKIIKHQLLNASHEKDYGPTE